MSTAVHTYIVAPTDFVDPRIRFDVALEENIDAFAKGWIYWVGAELQTHDRYVCVVKMKFI